MESMLSIEVGKTGVRRVVSRPITISEANEASLLTARISFPLRLLHETLNEQTTEPIKEITTQLFVPREEELGVFEQMSLGLAEEVEPIDHRNVPAWLIDALKRAHPRHPFWKNADQLPGGVSESAWMLLQEYSGSRGFLDHEGLIEDKRGLVLVSEPYGLNQEQIGTLMEFVPDGNLKFRFVGISNHYPSRTLRIEIWQG